MLEIGGPSGILTFDLGRWTLDFKPMSTKTELCPAQQRAFESISAGLQIGSIHRLWSGVGRGKTTVLKELHQQVGGAFLKLSNFVDASAKNHPLALEETLYRMLFDALASHNVVIMDDVHLLDLFSSG